MTNSYICVSKWYLAYQLWGTEINLKRQDVAVSKTQISDAPFSMCAKFSGKLTFFCTAGKREGSQILVLGKTLYTRTKWIIFYRMALYVMKDVEGPCKKNLFELTDV